VRDSFSVTRKQMRRLILSKDIKIMHAFGGEVSEEMLQRHASLTFALIKGELYRISLVEQGYLLTKEDK